MPEIVIPSLFVVAGICFQAGVSHSFLALRRRTVLHLVFGLQCFSALIFSLWSVRLYQSMTIPEYVSAMRWQIVVGDLWNVLFVWFVALYCSIRPHRLLLVHNALCLVVLVLNVSLPYTTLFQDVSGLEVRTLPWGEHVHNIDGSANTLAPLEYLLAVITFGFAYLCCYCQLRRGVYSSALFLALATSIQLLGVLINTLVHFAGVPFIYVSEFAFLAFFLVMTFRLANEMESADRALRQSEQRFRQMADTIQEVFYFSDSTGRVLYVSPAYERLTGQPRSEVKATPLAWMDSIVPADRERVQACYDNLMRGLPFDVEYRIQRVDGECRWLSDRAVPIYDEHGNVQRVAGVARDITDKKMAESLQQLTLENISDAVFITDDAGTFTFICPNANVIFGYNAEEVGRMGRIVQLVGEELFDPNYLEQHGEIRNIERRIYDKSGRGHDLLINVRRVSIEGGTRLFVCRDITDRKHAEEELKESEQRLQQQFAELESLYRTSPVGLCLMDNELRFVRINDELAAMNGVPAKEHVGQHLRDVLPSIASTIEPIYRRVLETGVPTLNIEVDKPSPTDPDEMRNYLVSYYPVQHPDGTVMGVGTVVQDISERKRTEQALRAREAQTRAILASLSAHIAVVDRTGRVVAANPAWVEFAHDNGGIGERCNVGANYLEVCRAATGAFADEASRVVAGLQAILEGTASEFTIEYPCHSPTRNRWFLMSATPLRDRQGGAVVSHVDISARVEAEQALRASEERMRAILNTAADAILTIDGQGTIEGVNHATEEMFGYRTNELVGQNVRMLMPSPYREEHDSYLARYLQTGEAHIIGFGREVVARRRDGSTFPVDLAISEVQHLGLFTGILRDITDRKEAEEALRRAHAFSESVINTARNIVLVLDLEGRIVQFNPYLETLTGWRLDEVKGHSWFDTFLPERVRPRIRNVFQRAIGLQPTQGNINPILAKDGREREIEWYDARLTNSKGELVGLLCTGQDITDRLRLQKEILDVSAQEQQRIGQELHDNVGQELTALQLYAQTLVLMLEQKELPESKYAKTVADLAQEALRHVRLLSRGLISVEVHSEGLTSALVGLVNRVNDLEGISATFECPRLVHVNDNQTATHLYRIAQEAVTNALKHGRANEIRVTFEEDAEHLTLMIQDDGTGFQPDSESATGVGLQTMRYRGELIGATIDIQSSPTQGTQVTCLLPNDRS